MTTKKNTIKNVRNKLISRSQINNIITGSSFAIKRKTRKKRRRGQKKKYAESVKKAGRRRSSEKSRVKLKFGKKAG